MKKQLISQTVLEYVMIVAIVAFTVIAFAPYIRNSISGNIRRAGDAISGGEVYDPGKEVDDPDGDTQTTVDDDVNWTAL